jgi:flagellar hook protein FlgE
LSVGACIRIRDWPRAGLASFQGSSMALGSVLQTALSGMSAAAAALDAVSHNLANSQTLGYKAQRPVFANETPATHSLGDSPTDSGGGANPRQSGTGVSVVGVAVDLSPGPLVVDASSGADAVGDESGDALVELSNVDSGQQLVDMILAHGQFRTSARVFDAAGRLLDELVNLGRR